MADRDSLDEQLEERAKELAEIQLEDYKRESARYVAALQEIADGRGKYADIAKRALGQ